MVQIWGKCVPPDVARAEWNGTILEFEIEGAACLNDSFCQAGDINALCFQVEEGEEGVCQCRQEMKWNSEARECQVEYFSFQNPGFLFYFFQFWQVYIEADCYDVKYGHSASGIFRNILRAEDVYRRGYTDPSEKREALLNLTNIDSFTLSLLGTVPGKLCEFYGNGFGPGGYRLQNACRVSPNNPAGYLLAKHLPSKYTLPIPKNRTQNPEEALQGSLLLFFTMNETDFHPITPPDTIPSMEAGWKNYLKEAFCRSVEPFSEVFDEYPNARELYRVKTEQGEIRLQTEMVNFDDPVNRPAGCWR